MEAALVRRVLMTHLGAMGAAAVLCLLTAAPARAQSDITGEWGPLYH